MSIGKHGKVIKWSRLNVDKPIRFSKSKLVIRGGIDMATAINNSNIYELSVTKNKFADLLNKLEKPGITREYLEECKRIAQLYKKPSK